MSARKRTYMDTSLNTAAAVTIMGLNIRADAWDYHLSRHYAV
jgi:hypothetical protein